MIYSIFIPPRYNIQYIYTSQVQRIPSSATRAESRSSLKIIILTVKPLTKNTNIIEATNPRRKNIGTKQNKSRPAHQVCCSCHVSVPGQNYFNALQWKNCVCLARNIAMDKLCLCLDKNIALEKLRKLFREKLLNL